MKEKKKILAVYAVEEEYVEIPTVNYQVFYCKTGIGKVAAAYHLMEALANYTPDLVVNFGSSGSLIHEIGEVLTCSIFVDRDMQPLTALKITSKYNFSSQLLQTFPDFPIKEFYSCNTGDSFVTEKIPFEGDVVDMEAFSIAYICWQKKIPFLSIKCVTDVIGKNSVQLWEEKLALAREQLQKKVRVLFK